MTRKAATISQSYWDAKLRQRRQHPVRQFVRCRHDGPRKRKVNEAEAIFRRSA